MSGNVLAGLLLGAIGVVAALNWWSRWVDRDDVERWTKPTVTVLVVVLALVVGGEPAPTAFGVAGLVLCLVGDVALMPAVDRFVVGLGSFLVGHLLFIPMFVLLGLDAPWLALVGLAGAAALGAFVGRRIVVAAAGHDPALRIPVMLYLVGILAMAVVAWSTGRPAAIVGATAFVVSDSILGWRKFIGGPRWMAPAIMATYHLAIVGIALSLAG